MKGVEQLKFAGIKIKSGVLKNEAEQQNEVFLKHIATGKPFVVLKMAQSANGIIGCRGKSELFGGDLKKIFPVIVPGGSDSATIDNVFELLYLSGRSLPHAMMMLIPGAWEEDHLLDEKIRAFYRFHTCFMEPWDGPAAMAFTDGAKIGALLDRNGLRPARYLVTKNDLVIMASEVGVLDELMILPLIL